jgi:DNA-binding transcriptional MerR regulator
MSQAKTKAFMSIGDVVEVLKPEFPDVTVSKVRFLEAEGLIDPERTPSGYRKFYSSDLARLRYILRLQRDQFVPLKVIRQRLEHFDPAETSEPQPDEPAVAPDPDEDLALATGLNLAFEELLAASGLAEDDLRELEEYGLIDSHSAEGGAIYYDEDDLLVAKIAKDFAKYGIEPRHMRMYRNFADRESGIFEQIVLPRNRAGGDGARQISQSLTELTKLSKRLKHLLLKAGLREHLGG